MSEAKVIRFPLRDVNIAKATAVKEIVDSNSINELPELEQPPEPQIHSISNLELETIKKEAFAEGYNKGKTEVLIETEEKEDALSAKLVGIASRIEELDKIHLHSLTDLSKDAAHLAIQVAKKLMGEVSNIHEHRIFKFFDEVLDKIKSESNITIFLEATFAETISGKLKELISKKDIKSNIKITAGDGLAEGECIIDWDHGKAMLNPEALLKSLETDMQAKPEHHTEAQNQNLQNQ